MKFFISEKRTSLLIIQKSNSFDIKNRKKAKGLRSRHVHYVKNKDKLADKQVIETVKREKKRIKDVRCIRMGGFPLTVCTCFSGKAIILTFLLKSINQLQFATK